MNSRGIKILMEDHQIILKLISGIKNMCIHAIYTEKISVEDCRKVLLYIREFADKHHHGVEEDFLFTTIEEEFGEVGEKLTRHGMVIEHEFARRMVLDLEERLKEYEESSEKSLGELVEVIGLLMAYKNHLEHHIEKEDQAIFTFADKNLSSEVLEKMDREIDEYLEVEGARKNELKEEIIAFTKKYHKE